MNMVSSRPEEPAGGAEGGRCGARPSEENHSPLWPRGKDLPSDGGPCSVMAAEKGVCRFSRIRFGLALSGRYGARPSRDAPHPENEGLTSLTSALTCTLTTSKLLTGLETKPDL